MSQTTQRMLPTVKAVAASPNKSILWGVAEDGCLNGGTILCAEILNQTGIALTVTILVKATSQSDFVPNTATVSVPSSATPTRIDLTVIVGYAIQLQGALASGGPADVTVSVQVQS